MLLMPIGLWLFAAVMADPLCTMRGANQRTEKLGFRGEIFFSRTQDDGITTDLLRTESNFCLRKWNMDNVMECSFSNESHSYSIKIQNVDDLSLLDLGAYEQLVSELHWEYSKLSEFNKTTFQNLTGLTFLSISEHDLGNITEIDRVFENLNNLNTLYLESSGIVSLDVSESPNLTAFSNLRLLSLANNPIQYLSNTTFSWLGGSSLEYLNLRDCRSIKSVAPGSLEPVGASLRSLDIGYSNMGRHLHCLLRNVTQLRQLGLAGIRLKRVPHEILSTLTPTLEVLSLYGNNLDEFQTGGCNCRSQQTCKTKGQSRLPPAKCVSQLYSPSTVFPEMLHLRELDLRLNNIMVIPNNTFYNASQLTTLLLSDNNIIIIEPDAFNSTSKLKILDISNNNPVESTCKGLYLDNNPFSQLVELESLILSHTKLAIISKNSFNPFGKTLNNLSLCYTQLPILDKNTFNPLSNLQVLDISGMNLSNRNDFNFSSNIFKGLISLKELYMSYSSFNNAISPFAHLTSLEVLNIRGNKLRSLNNSTFNGVTQLKILDISKNRINPWQQSILQKQRLLSQLSASYNLLIDITPAMFQDFEHLQVLDISHNPFLCYCSMINFSGLAGEFHGDIGDLTKFLLRKLPAADNRDLNLFTNNNANKMQQGTEDKDNLDYVQRYNTSSPNPLPEVKFWDDALAHICWNYEESQVHHISELTTENCLSREITPTSKETSNEEDVTRPSHTAVYGVCGLVVFLAVIAGICYNKRWYIKHFAQVLTHSTVLTFMDDPNDSAAIYHYDVFVSYCDADRSWVLEKVVPELEKNEDIKVCLHERDFQVGVSILENIVSAMDRSRWLLLVLSPSFVRSHWCQFELHLAQHRLLETRRNHLVLVLLQDIPSSQRPKLLRYLMLTRTFLVWPSDEGEHSQFWKRLRKAVGCREEKAIISIV